MGRLLICWPARLAPKFSKRLDDPREWPPMVTVPDMRSLAYAQGVVYLTLAYCLFHHRAQYKRYPGFRDWMLCPVLCGLGLGLIGGRGYLPDSLSIILANGLLVAALALLYTGVRRFVGRRPLVAIHLAVEVIVIGLLFPLLTYAFPNFRLRVVLFSLVAVAYFGAVLQILAKDIKGRFELTSPLITTSALCFLLLFIIRGVYFLLPLPIFHFRFDDTIMFGLAILILMPFSITLVVGWIQLHAQRLEKDLALEQRKLRESETRFRDLFSHTPVMIYALDQQGCLTTINTHWKQVCGYSRNQILGRPITDFLTPEARREFTDRHLPLLKAHHDLHEISIQMVTRTGGIIDVLLSHRSVHDTDGRLISSLGVIQDVSAQKAAAETQRRLQDQLRQAQKMESVGILAGGIAHNFNNILASIIGYTELVLDDVAADSPSAAHLQEVLRASKRARDLVKQILTFARRTDEEIKPLQVSRIAREVLTLVRSSIPATIAIEARLESDALVMANATQVHQMLMNLCTNAAYSMRGDSGTLSFDLTQVEVEPAGSRTPHPLSPGAYLKLIISDTGQGVPKALRDRIFEPYFSTKPPEEGTGMGLAMVHGIVEEYGGRITVSDNRPRGACFEILLPITHHGEPSASESDRTVPVGSENILFVDDEAPIAQLGERILTRLGYRVATETSAQAALERLQQSPDAFDLLVTDMTMPGMTGDRLAAAARDHCPNLPVVLCTGYRSPLSQARAEALGICAVVLKPVTMQRLAQTVRKVLDEVSID
jgi:two-component system, cell cycle sensor histidine kinase and response regulator CckA